MYHHIIYFPGCILFIPDIVPDPDLPPKSGSHMILISEHKHVTPTKNIKCY